MPCVRPQEQDLHRLHDRAGRGDDSEEGGEEEQHQHDLGGERGALIAGHPAHAAFIEADRFGAVQQSAGQNASEHAFPAEHLADHREPASVRSAAEAAASALEWHVPGLQEGKQGQHIRRQRDRGLIGETGQRRAKTENHFLVESAVQQQRSRVLGRHHQLHK